MSTSILMTGDEKDFFNHGKRLAKLADAGKKIPHELVISFEDPVMLLKLFTATKFALFKAIKERPDSITAIAERLHRDRSAVKRDIDQLAEAGIVTIEEQPLPGHGRIKRVKVAATQFKLEAQLI
jgi:predicted transcriptional regulator